MTNNLSSTLGEFHNANTYGFIGVYANSNEYLYAVQWKKSREEIYFRTRYFENSKKGYQEAVNFYKELMNESL